ncbi:MAG: type II toxin-antitoxin system VapC family toxin [Thermoguttaceae bacterium]
MTGTTKPATPDLLSKPTVYLESSVISMLAARPSNNVLTLAMQRHTHQWWNEERRHCELFVSATVLDEIRRGDASASQERMAIVQGLPILRHEPQIQRLADVLVLRHLLPKKALEDALHIATAAHYGINYLLTWNCTHIANSTNFRRIAKTIRESGFQAPVLCTPMNLSFQKKGYKDEHDSH